MGDGPGAAEMQQRSLASNLISFDALMHAIRGGGGGDAAGAAG